MKRPCNVQNRWEFKHEKAWKIQINVISTNMEGQVGAFRAVVRSLEQKEGLWVRQALLWDTPPVPELCPHFLQKVSKHRGNGSDCLERTKMMTNACTDVLVLMLASQHRVPTESLV